MTAWNRLRYGLYAPIYDFHMRRFMPDKRARSIGLLGLQKGHRVLITGAGTGLDLDHIPPGVGIAATDITPGMVRRMRARADALGIVDADIRVMDGQALEFEDGSFDAVVLHLILAVIPDPIRCINEAARVLRPGGRAVVLDKFLADGARPNLLRRAANLMTSIIATDINRSLGDIVAASPFEIVHREDAGLGGLFQIALLSRP